jgi:hypothetical protein
VTRDEAVLAFDPYAGDKDDGGYKVIRDVLVHARKETPCTTCGRPIHLRMKIRVMTSLHKDKGFSSTRDCEFCCDAMAAWTRGDHAPMEFRMRLRDSKDER